MIVRVSRVCALSDTHTLILPLPLTLDLAGADEISSNTEATIGTTKDAAIGPA